jgi:hypothetical protein
MPPKKVTTYFVRARQSVAQEMMRYEGNKIVTQTLKTFDPLFVPKGNERSDEVAESYATYLFKVEGVPNERRWASFGVSILKPEPFTGY